MFYKLVGESGEAASGQAFHISHDANETMPERKAGPDESKAVLCCPGYADNEPTLLFCYF